MKAKTDTPTFQKFVLYDLTPTLVPVFANWAESEKPFFFFYFYQKKGKKQK